MLVFGPIECNHTLALAGAGRRTPQEFFKVASKLIVRMCCDLDALVDEVVFVIRPDQKILHVLSHDNSMSLGEMFHSRDCVSQSNLSVIEPPHELKKCWTHSCGTSGGTGLFKQFGYAIVSRF